MTRTCRALLLAGLLARAAVLPLPGTEDVQVWKTWSYAATNGISSMYGIGGHPPHRGVVTWGARHTTVDYPPGGLYGLGLIGRLYRAIDPSYVDGTALTVAIKSTILLADGLVCLFVWLLATRWLGPRGGQTAALSYWLNPGTLMDGAVLGYLDPWAGAAMMGALLAADAALPLLTGLAIAVAVMTKVQAILAAPVAAILLMKRSTARARSILYATAAAIVTSAILLVPFAARGALPNVAQGVGSLFRHDMLSGTAANLWWIVTWLLRASYAVHDLGSWAAWTMPVRILGISRVVALGYPNPRPIGLALAAAAMAWAFWRTRHGTPALACAAGAFAVHAYFVLEVQVHENHLYAALPLAACAATVLPRLRAPYALMSVVFALNLWMFYGFGRGYPGPPRGITVIDATVWLSFVSVGALAWHARRLWQASEQPAHPPAIDRQCHAGDERCRR